MRGLRRRTALLAAIGTAVGVQLLGAPPSSAAATCGDTVASSGVHGHRLPRHPAAGATLTGTTEVTATATREPAGAAVIDRVNFWWGPGTAPTYLLADHDAPYRMVLDTTTAAQRSGTAAGPSRHGRRRCAEPGRRQVTIDNPDPRRRTARPSTPWLGGPQQPGERFRLALVGDGVDGSPESHGVADVIAAAHPDAFAYLGDVYDRGTPYEFDTWYAGPDGFGSSLDITNPTLGNHEYMESATAAPYFEFWDEIPHYYSYDIGGWHVVVLDSNTEFGQLGVNSAQYKWLQGRPRARTPTAARCCTRTTPASPTSTASAGRVSSPSGTCWSTAAPTSSWAATRTPTSAGSRWTVSRLPSPRDLTEFVVGTGGRPILNAKHPDAPDRRRHHHAGRAAPGPRRHGRRLHLRVGRRAVHRHRHDPLPHRTEVEPHVTSTRARRRRLGTRQRDRPLGRRRPRVARHPGDHRLRRRDHHGRPAGDDVHLHRDAAAAG